MPSVPLAYDFVAPGRILFGWGRRREVGALVRTLGRRVFLVAGSRTLDTSGAIDELAKSLIAVGLAVERLVSIHHEPLVADVDRAARQLIDAHAGPGDLLLAIGGGSAIDLAKAAAAMATNRHGDSVADFLEGVGRGLAITEQPLPLVAMPTTGGTGTEATKNAVISSDHPPFKKSLRSDWLLPRLVVVDPELALSLPPTTTAYTGMDAITQLIEAYLSRRAQPIPHALALSGLALASGSIRAAVHDGTSRAAREGMAHAALLSGMALANSGLGLAHGVAAALGIHAHVPHGLACAVMLPAAMSVNRPVREAELARVAEAMLHRSFASDAAAADAAIEHIEQLCRELSIPRRLSELGVRREQIGGLVQASRGNSMSGNPRELTDEELQRLLEEML
jgi:alcohol dehydrogenase class IV